MPCSRHVIRETGDTFRLRITSLQNVLAGFGRLRITGPATGHSQDFTLDQLEAGIERTLDADMTYTLRILIQPDDPAETSQITVQSSADSTDISCSRDGAGQIAEWTIDVF